MIKYKIPENIMYKSLQTRDAMFSFPNSSVIFRMLCTDIQLPFQSREIPDENVSFYHYHPTCTFYKSPLILDISEKILKPLRQSIHQIKSKRKSSLRIEIKQPEYISFIPYPGKVLSIHHPRLPCISCESARKTLYQIILNLSNFYIFQINRLDTYFKLSICIAGFTTLPSMP